MFLRKVCKIHVFAAGLQPCAIYTTRPQCRGNFPPMLYAKKLLKKDNISFFLVL